MTEAETRVKSEGADEESIVFKATFSEAPQVEASAIMARNVETAGSDANSEPFASVLVKVTEQSPTVITKEGVGDKVGVTDEQKKGSIPEREEGRKEVTIEREKGNTPSTNARRRPERKKKAAGDAGNAEPSRTVLVKVEEQVPAIMIVNSEDKAGEGGDMEQAPKGEVVEEGMKEGALSNRASRIQKRKKVALAVATTSATASAKTTKDNEEKTAVADKVESALSKEVESEEVPDERKKASTLGNKAKKLQKMRTAALATAETAKVNDKGKTNVADQVESAQSKEETHKEEVSDEEEKASTLSKKPKRLQEMRTTSLTVATTSAAITAETANDNVGKEEVADKDKVDQALSKKNKKRKKRNKAREAAAEAAGPAEVGAVKKLSITKEHAGMIFMCNADTKRDCYRYKVFGMPAGKKEAVANIYKGMKLFLFDIDLKLLYGIYIATSKGGYNIQPKAFKSAFPSQVRFKGLKDYLPLPEEKFKAAIKANYYQKRKFSLELSAEQVKNLSKLFVEATKASKLTHGRVTRERVPQDFTSHDGKRRRFQGRVSRPLIDEDDRIFPRSRDTYEREGYVLQLPLQVPFPHGSVVPRQAPLPLYSSPPQLAPRPPLPPPAYAYERPRDVEYYQRELPMEAHGYRVIDSEIRLPFDHVGHNDPYSLHREPVPYHETRYPLTLPSSYHAPPPAPAPPPYRY